MILVNKLLSFYYNRKRIYFIITKRGYDGNYWAFNPTSYKAVVKCKTLFVAKSVFLANGELNQIAEIPFNYANYIEIFGDMK